MLPPERALELVTNLLGPESRKNARQELARALSAVDVLLFGRDPEIDRLLPVRGFPQSISGATRWRAVLERIGSTGPESHVLPIPGGGEGVVTILGSRDAVLAAIGEGVDHAALAAFSPYLPLAGIALRAELTARASEANASAARAAAERADTLARALDESRRSLQGALRELQEEERRKDEFLAMLGHELRNPLAPVLSALALLHSRNDDPTAVTRYASVIGRHVQSLRALVDDLLDVSRVSRGQILLRKEPTSIAEVMDRAVEVVRPVIDAKGHMLTIERPEPDVLVDGDLVRLEQIFVNLLNNAAKYTDPRGKIRFTASLEGTSVEVSVVDDGLGISSDFLPRLFELFTQAPRGLDRSQGGLGVGLAIVKRLVEMHGGTVTAQSDGPGRGTTMRVRLPAKPPDSEARLAVVAHTPSARES